MSEERVCLTVAGLDPSGGAGLVADVKTFSAFGCYSAAVITSITFQNTTGVFGALHQNRSALKGQLEAVLDDLDVAAAKTGMLPTREVIEETGRLLAQRRVPHVVVDPVVRSTSGFDLIDNAALETLTSELFSLATVVTPNLQEAERITAMTIRAREDIEAAAAIMIRMGAQNVLIKGGHSLPADRAQGKARDYLIGSDGNLQVFEGEYIETSATHGTGCVLAAAIAANLALDRDLATAIATAKAFVAKGIRTGTGQGHGHSPINIPRPD